MPIAVSAIVARRLRTTSRVEATVDGAPLWFESDDAVLVPSPEGFASALLIPGLTSHRPLRLDAALDPVWLENCRSLLGVLNAWWDYPQLFPLAQRRSPSTRMSAGTALCFTGGVDSFYSLLQGRERPDHLLFVHGYDIPLGDTVRMAAFRTSLEKVAAAKGVKPVVIRTNLRTHPVFAKTDWGRAHGGALAAAGHLLSANVGRLLVPASYTYDNFHPWGTSWEIDPLWSSSAFEMVHDDASRWRLDKLASVGREPLVRHHLRVCWENRRPTGNCCACEKCVRTMICLELAGELGHFPAFDPTGPLPGLIDRMPAIPRPAISQYEMLLRRDLKPELRDAIGRWIERSRSGSGGRSRSCGPGGWLWKRLRAFRGGGS